MPLPTAILLTQRACLSNRETALMLPIVPQAADDIDDGDAALTAFATMHSGWMAAYRDHPRRKWR